MRKATILVATLLSVAVAHTALSALTQHLGPWETTRIIDAAGIQVDLVYHENRGTALALFEGGGSQALLSASISAFFAIGLLVLFLSLVDQRYTFQLVALSCIVDGSLVQAGETLLWGYTVDYFRIGLDRYYFPDFNIAGLAGTAGWLLLYGGIAFRYFRWLPEPWSARTEVEGLHDPLYERRRPLRVILGIFIVWGAVILLIQYTYLLFAGYFTASGRPGALNPEEYGSPMAAVFSTALNTLTLVAAIAVWRMIPKRPIDALFLRAFGADKKGWAAVKDLRRLLEPRLRLSGVVDPKESRRTVYLLYWILMPFALGIGDMGRVNAFRHNLFISDRWKEDLERAFPHVRFAIFDCRAITPNVAWELDLAMKTLARRNVFFLVGNDPAALQPELAAYGPAALDADQCFPIGNLRELAEGVLLRSAA
ncbi:MAG TPA: signal peptidase II [Terriglobales bacterium]